MKNILIILFCFVTIGLQAQKAERKVLTKVNLNQDTTQFSDFYVIRNADSLWIEKPLGTFKQRLDSVRGGTGEQATFTGNKTIDGTLTVTESIFGDTLYISKAVLGDTTKGLVVANGQFATQEIYSKKDTVQFIATTTDTIVTDKDANIKTTGYVRASGFYTSTDTAATKAEVRAVTGGSLDSAKLVTKYNFIEGLNLSKFDMITPIGEIRLDSNLLLSGGSALAVVTEYIINEKGLNAKYNYADLNTSNPRWIPDKNYVDSVADNNSVFNSIKVGISPDTTIINSDGITTQGTVKADSANIESALFGNSTGWVKIAPDNGLGTSVALTVENANDTIAKFQSYGAEYKHSFLNDGYYQTYGTSEAHYRNAEMAFTGSTYALSISPTAMFITDKTDTSEMRPDGITTTGFVRAKNPHYNSVFMDSAVVIDIADTVQITNPSKNLWPSTELYGFTESGDTAIATYAGGYNYSFSLSGSSSATGHVFFLYKKSGANTTTVYKMQEDGSTSRFGTSFNVHLHLLAGDKLWMEAAAYGTTSVTFRQGSINILTEHLN